MPLTLNQFLFLVITFAIVIAVTFLVILFSQLRKTAKEGEETLVEIKSLVTNLRNLSQSIHTKIEDLDEILETTKKTAVSLSEISWFLVAKIIRPSSRFWPFLFPFLRLGWRQLKKRKEEKNGK